jgi:hypothetical protein
MSVCLLCVSAALCAGSGLAIPRPSSPIDCVKDETEKAAKAPPPQKAVEP